MTLKREIAALHKMTSTQLRARYAEVFGEPIRSGNKQHLVKRIAWRLQAQAEGGLSERARRRAEQLARDADVRQTPPKTAPATDDGSTRTGCLPTTNGHLPPPGTVLVRPYKGEQIQVTVLEDGFEYDGKVYRSLSAVAKHITGSHLSGRRFFNLTGK